MSASSAWLGAVFRNGPTWGYQVRTQAGHLWTYRTGFRTSRAACANMAADLASMETARYQIGIGGEELEIDDVLKLVTPADGLDVIRLSVGHETGRIAIRGVSGTVTRIR